MLLDIEMIVIRSNITAEARADAAEKFNSKLSSAKMLLGTYQTCS